MFYHLKIKGIAACLLLLAYVVFISGAKAQLLYQPELPFQPRSSEVPVNDNQAAFIQLPVRMGGQGMNAVTGFHLYLSYNNQKLQFSGISPGAVANVAVIPTNGVLSMQYSNIQAPINCTQPVIMFYINFTRLATGDVPLTFLPGSQVAGLSSLLPVTFQHGMVFQTWQLDLQSAPVGAGVLSGGGEYLPGQGASVSAVATQGYYFINWTRDGQIVSTQPDFDYTMPAQNVTLTANFGLNSYMLQLQANPANGGSVSGAGAYAFGQTVQVQAVPNTGWAFTGWMQDGQLISTDPNYTFSMPAGNLLLWANFEQLFYPLQLTVNPGGAGSVSGSGNYAYNSQVTVQATPNTGWQFTGWTMNGQLVSGNATYTFSMPASGVQLQANFEQILYPVQLTVNPEQAGSVVGSGNYAYNTQVTVQATPNTGWQFVGWTIDGQLVSGNANYTFTMPATGLSIQANFELVLYPLQLTVNPPGAGSVTGSGSYAFNTQVTVQAVPGPEYNFISWNQGSTVVSTNPIYTFVMPANALLLTARFSLKTYLIQVASSDPDHGTVTGEGTYTHGQTVTVSAQAAPGYQFIAWTEQGQVVSQLPEFSFIATANRSLIALFQPVMVCPQPLSLMITQIGEDFAAISWVSPSSVDQWDLVWGPAGFNPTSGGTLVNGLNQAFYQIVGLNPQTTYDVYVRAWCESSYVSDWSEPLTFMTYYVGLGEDAPFTLSVFPNPASTYLNLLIPAGTGPTSAEIFSTDGRLMHHVSDLQSASGIDISHLPEGLFTLKLRRNAKTAITRFVVKRY
ncbi:MAG TPA: InlB B-repeat-containing protein [Bacteroidales bacterium]|nr:InlB B-repeat-containing protein [Bacteroidales bacterium]